VVKDYKEHVGETNNVAGETLEGPPIVGRKGGFGA
jgi:hypothetical protein